MKFLKNIIKNGSIGTHILKCCGNDGRQCYFVIACTQEKFRAIMQDSAEGALLDVADYGHIIDSGYGSGPGKKAINYLKKEYGVRLDDLQ